MIPSFIMLTPFYKNLLKPNFYHFFNHSNKVSWLLHISLFAWYLLYKLKVKYTFDRCHVYFNLNLHLKFVVISFSHSFYFCFICCYNGFSFQSFDISKWRFQFWLLQCLKFARILSTRFCFIFTFIRKCNWRWSLFSQREGELCLWTKRSTLSPSNQIESICISNW